MSFPRFVRLAAAGVAMLLIAGCSASPVGAPNTTVKTPVVETSNLRTADGLLPIGPLSVSQVVYGPKGGSMAVGSFRLDIPAGAFKDSATITITQPDPAVLKCDLSISPASANQFAVPVIFTSLVPNALALTSDQNFWYDPSVDAWRAIGTSNDGVRLELHSQLWHFSSYCTGRAGW